MASLNSRLLRLKSISLRGITVNQLDDPFSLASSATLCIFSGSELLHCHASHVDLRPSPYACTAAAHTLSPHLQASNNNNNNNNNNNSNNNSE